MPIQTRQSLKIVDAKHNAYNVAVAAGAGGRTASASSRTSCSPATMPWRAWMMAQTRWVDSGVSGYRLGRVMADGAIWLPPTAC